VSQTLDHAVESRHPIQLEMALSHLALFIEVRGSCKLKVVQRVLSLFRPRDSVDCAKERAEVTEAGDLSGLDDAALYRRLVTISQGLSRWLFWIILSSKLFLRHLTYHLPFRGYLRADIRKPLFFRSL
jgi:hypothetical protein